MTTLRDSSGGRTLQIRLKLFGQAPK